MSDLVGRLTALGPIISRICSVSGTPGVSIGLLHHGEVIHTAAYGYRDVEAQLAPDEHTVYHIASMSKAITSHGLAFLKDEGKFDWDTPLAELVPQLRHPDPTIQRETTMADILSHRTGLASQAQFFMQEYGRLSLPQTETVNIFSHLPVTYEFRKRWIYGNWGYSLAAAMFESLSGSSWGDYLHSHLFAPLGMTRTTTQRNPSLDNVAKGYIALEDGSPFLNERPHICDGSLMSGAAGVQSTVHDLLVFYKSLLYADASPESLFKDLPRILSPAISLPGSTDGNRAYGLGWTLTELPAPLGDTGINGMSVPEKPVVGRGLNRTRIYHHNGSLAGFLSCVHLLPESKSAIVVLTNALSKNDCADWLAQLILETLLDAPEKNDYEQIAHDSAKKSVDDWKGMEEQLAKNRSPNTTASVPLGEYGGKYFNDAGDWYIEIFSDADDELHMSIQGDRRETYRLQHYHNDTFSWFLSWDETVKMGRFRIPSADYYLLKFQVKDQKVTGVRWTVDGDVPDQFFPKGPCQTNTVCREMTEKAEL